MKKNSKFLCCSIAIGIGLFFVSCEGLKSRIIDIDKLKVGYVVSKGSLEDKGQTQLGYLGIEKGESEFKIKAKVLEGNKEDKEGFQKNIKKIAEKNDLVIVMGDEFKASINEVANNYRDKKFAVIGEGMKESNIQDITFKYEEGTFLLGVLAGKETKTNKVGFIGEKNKSIDSLISGYVAGVKVVNGEAAKDLMNEKNIRYVENTNNDDVHNITKEMYSEGIDIIFTNLGKEGIEVFKAANESKKYAIGMGMNCKELYPQYKENILTSLVVRTDELVSEIIQEVEDGNFKSGEKNSKVLGLKGGVIEMPEDTKNSVATETMTIINQYKEKIINKQITIPKRLSEVLEYKIE